MEPEGSYGRAVREAKDSGDVVGARLRAVLDPGATGRTVPDHGPLDWADVVPAWSSEDDDVPPLGVSRSGDSSGTSASGPGEAGAGGGDSRGSSGYPWDGAAVSRDGGSVSWDSGSGAWDTASGTRGRASSVSRDAASVRRDAAFVGRDAGSVGRDASFVGRDAASVGWDAASVGAAPGDGLSGAGAFGGGRRQWLNAFDPGRPGVRALAVVAVVVVLVAAFLAWRSRPRLDPVVPDPGGAVAASGAARGSGSGSGPGAGSAPGPGSKSGPGEVVVAVGGKVRRPGLVRLSPGARVADALAAAGGAEPGVDVAVLNLARRVTDGELIMVGVALPPGATATAAAPPGATGSLVDLNTATLAQLDGLPGVGPVLAQRILDARQAQGGFRGVSDLRKVDGIGDARYEQLKDLVTV